MNAAENPAAKDDARRRLAREFHALGVRPDDTLMVHASIRSAGPIAGGAKTLLSALRDAVGVGGTLMGFASWRDSPYEETLDGRELPPERRKAWPAFDPRSAAVYSGFGMFNELIRVEPDASRSTHPDASMVAVGRHARWLTAHHAFDDAYGPTSPLGRLVEASGRVILLGAPLDSITILHLAEAIARIPGKQSVSYEMPLLEKDGRKTWVHWGRQRLNRHVVNGMSDVNHFGDNTAAKRFFGRSTWSDASDSVWPISSEEAVSVITPVVEHSPQPLKSLLVDLGNAPFCQLQLFGNVLEGYMSKIVIDQHLSLTGGEFE